MIFSGVHFRRARKDLKRSDQVEDFNAGSRHEYDPPRPRFEWRFVGLEYQFRFQLEEPDAADRGAAAVTNLSGAASKVFLSSSEQK